MAADVSTILSGASKALAPFTVAGGPWGIAAGLSSALLSIGAMLTTSSPTPHVDRVRDATPLIVAALQRAEAEKARLNASATVKA